MGIDVERSTLTGNVLGCALGGVGGVLLGIYYGTIVPTMGGAVGNEGIQRLSAGAA